MTLFLMTLLMAASAAGTEVPPVANPTTAQFTASADHATVTNYQLDTMAGSATGAIAFTLNLGKPTPNAANLISVLVQPFATLPPGTYVATVSAMGPGGAGKSAPSAPFARVGAPASPTGLVVL